jgi:V/A-type H+/Na+-transporting ATPase subunit C
VYEYANARIRGLRSRLLSAPDLDALAARPDVGDLIGALARTDYGPDLERARETGSGGLALVDEALRRNLSRRLRSVLGFFDAEGPVRPSQGRRLVGMLLARYDLLNVVVILRGKAATAALEAIEAGLVPAGELDDGRLARLAQTPDIAGCIAQLARLRLPYVGPLVAALPAFEQERRLVPLELALRRGFLEWAERELHGGGANAAMVRAALALEADATNVLTVLRLLRRDARPQPEALAALLLPGGALTVAELAALLGQPSVGEAVATLGRAPFRRALAAGAPLSALLDEEVALEWAVERYLARWAQAQVYRDPLGIALALAYQAAKAEEVRSLRLVARGLAAGWARERVRHLLAASAA